MAIAADYKRYVLGRGFAQKILVEPVKPQKNPNLSESDPNSKKPQSHKDHKE
jgi:hypothetical protein